MIWCWYGWSEELRWGLRVKRLVVTIGSESEGLRARSLETSLNRASHAFLIPQPSWLTNLRVIHINHHQYKQIQNISFLYLGEFECDIFIAPALYETGANESITSLALFLSYFWVENIVERQRNICAYAPLQFLAVTWRIAKDGERRLRLRILKTLVQK